MAVQFTASRIEALHPTDKLYRVQDTLVPALYCNVTPKGVKSFCIIQRPKGGKPVTITLGRFPILSVDAARRSARTLLPQILDGTHSAHKVLTITVAEAYQQYIASRNLTTITVDDYNRGLEAGLSKWKQRRLTDISPADVLSKYKTLCKASQARASNVFRVFRAVYNYHRAANLDANRKPLLSENPVNILRDSKQWTKPKRKKSLIRADAMQQWYEALQQLPTEFRSHQAKAVASLLHTMLFTGLRSGELRLLASSRATYKTGMKGYYDKASHLIYLYDQKNHEEIEIPLSTHVVVDDSDVWLFGHGGAPVSYETLTNAVGWIKRKTALHNPSHDLRRTFITVAESLDLSPYTIKRLVGHKVSDAQDVTGGYIIHANDRLRHAAQAVGDAIYGHACGASPR
ncbi:MAG: hypothetical protein BWK73_20260 [Thiothrix lacustris]|uniref:Integrase n=1 Tax=Thiothrix lacustris TaxID=525917 RepID=A0A1Y1QP75_9GAMM|nr:MAG: hypothetical protein BWK73_20260 [Thiothrix lacustris]